MTKNLLSIGHGYSAQALAALLAPRGWSITGTTREADKVKASQETDTRLILWASDELPSAITAASHILISAGPGKDGDPFLQRYATELKEQAAHLEWVGYLSTTGVYGDHQGGWVDEATPLTPSTARGKQRIIAEAQWQSIDGLPLHIFRLAGIYGPGRGPFEKVRQGSARRIIKQNQVFSRIHVDDIAQVLAASIARPNPGAIYNLCDDNPAPPQDVIGYAAELLGLPLPAEIPYESAELTPMARSFYAESKRVRNDRIKEELGVRLIHPDYRSGLRALLREGE